MFNKILLVLLITSSLVIVACSNEEDQVTSEEPNKEHFASDQKRALDKAKGVEQMLQDGADKRAQQIDEQSR
jgi:PBP1b-binding outer membrane lipoprotein LpoB